MLQRIAQPGYPVKPILAVHASCGLFARGHSFVLLSIEFTMQIGYNFIVLLTAIILTFYITSKEVF
jgi:hypothetical protein